MVRILWLKPTKGMISIGRNLIAEEMRKRDFEVEIYECSGVRFIKALVHALKSDYDVLIGTTHLGLALGGIIKLLRDVKFIADFVDRYGLLFKIYPIYLYPFVILTVILEKLSLKIADAVIVVPLEDYNRLVDQRSRVIKCNLCIDLDRFVYVDKKTLLKTRKILEKVGVAFNKPKVVYVGGFSKIYNLNVLIESMRYLQNFQLILIGGGKMKSYLKKLKDKLNLSNVFFLDYQPNYLISGFLRHCDVGVSLCEIPRQLKIYEYLASGLGVVVSKDVLNSNEFEFDELCVGVDLNAHDVARGIREAMQLRTIDNYKKILKRLDNYSCKVVSKLYLKVLKELLQK